MEFIISALVVVFCICFINFFGNGNKEDLELKATIDKFGDGSNCIDARIVSRRTSSSGQQTYTRFFVTFENIKSGDRIEIEFSGQKFGMMAEGDRGKLIYANNKLSFERDKKVEEKIKIQDIVIDTKVVAKRIKDDSINGGRIQYFVTFEDLLTCELKEIALSSEKYAMIVEGDRGKLIYKGEKVFFEKEKVASKNIVTVKVDVKVVGKRLKFEGVNGGYTEYFVTFEDISSSERKEIKLSGEEYGMIAEGDSGKLVYKGEKVSFEREIHTSKKIDLEKR